MSAPPPDEVWGYNPKKWLAELLDRLMDVRGPSGIADLQLDDEDADPEAAAKRAAKQADDVSIAAGKEDIASHRFALMNALDSIPDADDRRRAYDAAYRVLNGAFLVAKSGIVPLQEAQRSQGAQAGAARRGKIKKLNKRDAIVLSVINQNRSDKLPASAGRLLGRVNAALVKAGRKEIDRTAFYRTKRRHRSDAGPK